MTEWKAGDLAMVKVREIFDDCRLVALEGSSGVLFTSALRPIPTALSAEDALRDPSEDEAKQALIAYLNAVWNGDNLAPMAVAIKTVLAERRRSTPPAAVALPTTPDTTALRDAVVEAAKEQAQRGVELANARGGVAEQAARHAYTQACGETNTRGRALLAAEAPADPVAELREAADELLRAQDNHPLTYDKSSPHRPQAANNLHKAMDRLRAALSAIGDRGRG